MTERTRNIAVGLTVIVALILLGTLILIFTGVPQLLQTGYLVTMRFDNTYDIVEGDEVHLYGITVGKVIDVSFVNPDDPAKGVAFVARIERGTRLPGNTVAVVLTKGLVGKGYLELRPEGPPARDPVTGKPLAHLPTDGSAVLEGVHRGDGLFPSELTQALENVSKLAKTLNEALGPGEPAPAATAATSQAASSPAEGLRGTIVRLNRTLDALYTVMGSEQNQANIKAALAAMADAAAKTNEAIVAFKEFADQARQSTKDMTGVVSRAGDKIDALAEKLIQDADGVSRLMVALEQAVRKADSGEGTMGKMINDPQLYNAMLDATRQLNDLLIETRQLVDTWRASGLELKLK